MDENNIKMRAGKKLSQSEQLKRILKDTYRTVIIGVIFLVVYSIINLVTSMLNMEQIESTMYLNQYRLGSKALTSAVQSYAVTGEQRYYDDYMNELNVEKNRDVAWAGLKKMI